MRELAMRPIDLAPLIEQRDDRGALVGEQPMHRARARAVILEAAGFTALIPAPRPPLGELEILAHATMTPARPGRPVDQAQQARFGGRVDAARNRATQSQRPFPSASINRTPISFSASDSLAISARASASSGSTPLGRTPGRDAAKASSAPCLATSRSFITVERSTPARSAASLIVLSPRSSPSQISYFCDGDKNRLRRRPPLGGFCGPDSGMTGSLSKSRRASQMRSNQTPDLWR